MLFNVLVHGENFFMRLDERKEFVGFYVNLTVDAEDFENAENTAIDTLRKHPNLAGSVLNRPWQAKPMMYVEEIEASSEEETSIGGFIWYVIGKKAAPKFGPN